MDWLDKGYIPRKTNQELTAKEIEKLLGEQTSVILNTVDGRLERWKLE